jgi:hypothetical protein
MTILMGKSYRALVAQALTCCYFVCALSLSPFQSVLFLRSTSLEQGDILDHQVITSANVFYSQSSA